ncbi:MAG TPA: GyrI-like domain-containing protein [Thermoleophilia bacterium]|nr:GyrI-like domain-containing protein [Thermoleophilia bacterium]
MAYDVKFKDTPEQLVLAVHDRVTMSTIAERLGAAFGEIMACGQAAGVTYAGPPFVQYPERFDEGTEGEIVVCMPVAPGATGAERVALEEIPATRVASTMHVGPYHDISPAYEALMAAMTAEGLGPGGPPREIYLNDPGTVPEHALLTEIDWPVA